MQNSLIRDDLHRLRDAGAVLGSVDAETAARLITATADVTLVVDEGGVIRDLALGGAVRGESVPGAWLGRPWVDVVTVESREKVERLLREATPNAVSPWREINHPLSQGPDLPILYASLRLSDGGPVIAVGRDLRGVADMQRKLVDAQAAMERDYARLRQAEMRYRLLFQIAAEPVLIVEAAGRRVTEANPAAAALLGSDPVGGALGALFAEGGAERVGELLATARATGRAEGKGFRLAPGGEVGLSVSLFRQERSTSFLVRLLADPGRVAAGPEPAESRLLEIVENLPDAVVVCDVDRRVLTANTAFLELAQLPTLDQARGVPLETWIGRSGVDTNVLVASLREHGSVRHFGTVVRGVLGGSEEVEIAAVAVPDGTPPCYGLSIRPVGRRLAALPGASGRVPASVSHLTELVGRVSMKELVRETTDLIERMCIVAALELTNDNRASAAEMLGLSRQSFYAKMRRFGLGDLGGEEDEGE